MAAVADRVSMLVGLDRGRTGQLERDGTPLTTNDLDVLSSCSIEDFDAALELVEALIESAADRLQPRGFATNYERAAFAEGRDAGRIGDIATLHARRDLLRDLRNSA